MSSRISSSTSSCSEPRRLQPTTPTYTASAPSSKAILAICLLPPGAIIITISDPLFLQISLRAHQHTRERLNKTFIVLRPAKTVEQLDQHPTIVETPVHLHRI